MRGTVPHVVYNGTVTGITPACAGNRIRLVVSEPDKADHPRVCGEQLVVASFAPCVKDHPRVCGEQELRKVELREVEGSPPRVRGTVHVYQLSYHHQGITPACAGNRKR